MKKLHKLKLLFLAALFGAIPLLQSQPAKADTLGAMTSYTLANTNPNHIVEGPDGNLWVSGSKYNSSTWHMSYYTYRVDRSNGSYATYNSSPNDMEMTLGPDGNLWATGTFYVTKLNTNTGANAEYDSPDANANPWWGLTSGPDGNIWFGMNGSKNVNGQTVAVDKIGRISTSGIFQTSFDLNGVSTTALAGDKAHNVVWYGARAVTGPGGFIGSFSPSGTQVQYSIPSITSGPTDLTIGPDGNIWFSAEGNKIGKMTPTGEFTLYTLTPPGQLRNITWGKDGYMWLTVYSKNQIARVAQDGSATYYTLPVNEAASDIASTRDGNIWAITANAHQLIKVGTGFTDTDEDGLQDSLENAQGTSNSSADTDNDGLSDYVESTSYPERNAVFCNAGATTCEYPNPTGKDVYIENDWMVKPGSGGYSMKLNSSEVATLNSAYLAKGINLHIDTGQLGGGGEVSYQPSLQYEPQTGQTDFYDYKDGGDGVSAQMSPLRQGIYHYLITGQSYAEDSGSTGVSYVGDDDLFVSYGLIKEDFQNYYTSFDTAISGTVMHELGHNLCLSAYNNGNPVYSGQPASCRFNGIDMHAGTSYGSVMNYDQQLVQVNYSDGVNGPIVDHDDWGAVRLGDFALSSAGDAAHGTENTNPTLKTKKSKRNSNNMKPIIGPSKEDLHRVRDIR